MKRSNTSADFERISEDEHIEKIVLEIKHRIPEYFNKIADSTLAWNLLINEAIEKYDKEAAKYRVMFDEEAMEEHHENDDPKFFKNELKKACPIIHKTFFSKLEELQEWKESFTMAKPENIFDTISNYLDFIWEYESKLEESSYSSNCKVVDFSEALTPLDNDESYFLHNVLGTGILTTIIYNLVPKYCNKSVRRTLYGLYFLTTDSHIIAPSRTSEFVMIDDNKYSSRRGSEYNMRIEHNFWYPYSLFMFYSKLIYDEISRLFSEIGISLDVKYRFMYVNLFLEQISLQNKEAVKTMMGGDQDF